MKFSVPFLLPLALAAPLHNHHDHLAKRAEATVVVTEHVTVTAGVDGASATTSAVVQESTVSDVQQLSGSSFETVYQSSATASYSQEESSATGSATSTAATASSSSSSSSSSSGSGAKGITYSPYTDSGSCKDADTIASDIAKLTDYDVIRLYDTDCDGVSSSLAAISSSQKLFLGIYYMDKIADSVSIISDAIESAGGDWDVVYTVSVGNELVNSGDASASDISGYIDTARTALTSAGYNGTVVSVDTLVAVQNNPELCDYSDFVAVNSHPFWDGNVEAADSGAWLKEQISNIGSVCDGKTVLITETGWPTQGDSYGVAVPSTANQESAISSIAEECGDQVILFTMYNDLWKDAGDYGVEQYWGIFD